jgi:colanic acid/amylovoran biosynthesis protein
MLSRMTLVLVREPLSLARAKELGIGPITFLTADEAFLLPRLRSKRVDEILESLKTEKIVVGISVRNWNFPMAVNPYKERKKYENAIVESVDAIVHKTGAKVLIAVHNIHERVANDYSIALRIFRRVRFPERLTVLPTSLLPQEEKEILAHVDVFVGTRLHSNIFSLGVETPVIAISYSPKTVGVMSMLDLSDWMIPIEDFCNDPKILCPKVQKLLDRSVRERYIARLRPRLSEVTGAARSNARFIRMILSNRPELVVSEGPRSRTSQDEWLE